MSLNYHDVENAMTPKALRVVILGPLRHLMKIDEVEMPFPGDGSHRAFWNAMLAKFPQLGANPGSIRLARHSRFLLSNEMINPGDEIALIPPVSGG